MRASHRAVTGVATATLALLLVACNDSGSSSDDSTAAQPSATSSKSAPQAPGKAVTPPTSDSAQPTASSDPQFSSDEVCAKLPAARIHELIGYTDQQKVTPTDITADIYATGDSDPEKRDPSLCTYNLDVEPNFVAIGLLEGQEADQEWAKVKAKDASRFRHDLGGDETADAGEGIYVVHKGDKVILIQGILSGLSTTDLEKVVREAAGIL